MVDKAAWLAEHLGKDDVPTLHYEYGETTGDAMLEIINAMRKRGYDMQINHNAPSPRTLVRFWRVNTNEDALVWADTLSTTIIEAAYEALHQENENVHRS